MKVWVYVEGQSDKDGLEALWKKWRERLQERGWRIEIIPLGNKARFLSTFGARAAQKLVGAVSDLVVGIPDLHPTAPYETTGFKHADAATLKSVQLREVRHALAANHNCPADDVDLLMRRFLPSVFKHDFEMLLLAAAESLREHLGTNDRLGQWRVPVEDQNLGKPPKRVVKDLFTKYRRKLAYRGTKDAKAVLGKVEDVASVLRTGSGQWTCPEFVEVLRWLGDKTGVPVCDLAPNGPRRRRSTASKRRGKRP